jgi:hypothetical protein
METVPDPATAYRTAHCRKLMVLAKGKNLAPRREEFCRIRSVETLAPGLWITAIFLDGSIRQFRPEKIRDATPDEERQALEAPAIPANAPAPV